MVSTMRRLVGAVLFPLLLPLVFWAEQAQAQCQGGQQRNRSLQAGTSRQSTMQAAMQQAALQTAMQQSALQAAMQQSALQAAYQRNVLQTAVQQNALLLALQQQQAQLQSTASPPRVSPGAGSGDSLPRPANPEESAARQLKIARELVADADTAQQQGETNRATRMRDRAGERLQQVVANYSGTKAADEAQELLQKNLRATTK
jgi:hypothetical protein